MRFRSLAACASAFCLTSAAFSQVPRSRPEILSAADASAPTHFSVFLPSTHRAELNQLLDDQVNPASPSFHKWLTPSEFKARFGPSPADVAKVKRSLEAAGLTVTAEHTQGIEVTGPVSSVEHLFATRLQQVRMPKGNVKLATLNHKLTLPAELASVGAIIPQFNPQLTAHVHSERLNTAGAAYSPIKLGGGMVNQRLSTADSWFYPDDMNEAYDFPSFTTKVAPGGKGTPQQVVGLGAKIGIVISSTIKQADLNKAFNSSVTAGSAVDVQAFSKNTTLPVPVVTIEPVDGGSGAFDPNSDDALEASLDTQESLGTAPGAQETVYDMPDLSDSSIIDAYAQVNDDNTVDVVSSSFGECELDYTAAANGGTDFTALLQLYHALFAQGNAQGITFVASSGDNGAVPCLSTAFDNNPTNGTNYVLGVESPASDPDVTAVGGTNLEAAATPTTNDSTYAAENANFDPRVPAQFQLSATETVTVGNNTWGSGGGYSIIFGKPSYQAVVNTGSSTARAVPAVSLQMGGCPGDADLEAQDCTKLPRSASIIFVNGAPDLVIGTSSSSPQMAGVIALSVELAGTRLGNINTQLYRLSALQTAASGKTANLSQFFHRNVSGNNNGYTVSPGQSYSTVLGNGTLFVKNYLQLSGATPAGTPNTASNP